MVPSLGSGLGLEPQQGWVGVSIGNGTGFKFGPGTRVGLWLALVGVKARLWLPLGLGVGEGHSPATPFSSQNFIKAKQYPPRTQVEVQNDGAESPIFQQLFQKWTVPSRTSGLGKTHTVGSVGEGWPETGQGWEPGVGSGVTCLPPSSFICTLTLALGSPHGVGTPRDMGKLKNCHKKGAENNPFIWNGIGSLWMLEGFSLPPDNIY